MEKTNKKAETEGNEGKVIFYPVPDFVAKSRLPDKAKILYGLLVFRSQNGEKPCWPRQKTIAKDISTSPRNTRNHLDTLKDLGLVTATQNGKKRPNTYNVTPMENADRDAISAWRPDSDRNSTSHHSSTDDRNPTSAHSEESDDERASDRNSTSSHERLSDRKPSSSCDRNPASSPLEKISVTDKVTDSSLPLPSQGSGRGCAAALPPPNDKNQNRPEEEEDIEAIPEYAETQVTEDSDANYSSREDEGWVEENDRDGFGAIGEDIIELGVTLRSDGRWMTMRDWVEFITTPEFLTAKRRSLEMQKDGTHCNFTETPEFISARSMYEVWVKERCMA